VFLRALLERRSQGIGCRSLTSASAATTAISSQRTEVEVFATTEGLTSQVIQDR